MKFELGTFNRNATDEELLQDLVAAVAKLRIRGKVLTFRLYREVGNFSAATIDSRFGSWNDGLRKAGLLPTEERNIPVQALFDNLKLVWIAKGRQPVFRDMNIEPSQYAGSTYHDRFGGWRRALQAFVASVNQEQNELRSYEAEVKLEGFTKKTKRDPSLGLRFLVLKRDRFRCVACGRSPATVAGLVLEIDHIFPWARGGETIDENLQTMCFDCNRGKGVT